MLTVYQNTEHIFNALAAGATGYLLKQTPPAELLAAIQEVHAGGSPMSSHIARKIVQSFQQPAPPSPEAQSLSPRESRGAGSAGQGISLQGNCRHDESDLRHRAHPHPPHLRKTPRAVAHRSRGQASWPDAAFRPDAAGLISRFHHARRVTRIGDGGESEDVVSLRQEIQEPDRRIAGRIVVCGFNFDYFDVDWKKNCATITRHRISHNT